MPLPGERVLPARAGRSIRWVFELFARVPLDVSYFIITGENFADRAGQLFEFLRPVNLPDKPSEHGVFWISETEELIIISVLVPAANSQPKPFVYNGNIPTPILADNILGLYAVVGQIRCQILRKSFTPDVRIYFFLFTVIGWKLAGSKFNECLQDRSPLLIGC
jgi:hypothetical protein